MKINSYGLAFVLTLPEIRDIMRDIGGILEGYWRVRKNELIGEELFLTNRLSALR
jgi:hypothetical protein